jgi:putative transposase
MPWKESTPMSERAEFVAKALQEDVNMSALCQEYGISRKTGYKWLRRYQEQGRAGLEDRSRRPHEHPGRIPAAMERVILARRAGRGWQVTLLFP